MGNRFIALLLLLGSGIAAASDTREAVMLRYLVSEPGLEPYPSRILLAGGLLRMDDGEGQGNYLLYDTRRKLISSVTHEDGTVLEIPLRPVMGAPPLPLQREQLLEPDEKAPLVGGKQPHQLRLQVNGKACYDAVVVPGLLPELGEALRGFNRVLAGEQGKLLGEIPDEMVDGCDLALHTFYPEWPLESGLAIQEFDLSLQRGRLLVDIDPAFKVDAALFELPPDYRHYTTP